MMSVHIADEVTRRIPSPSASMRTARSGSFGVACRPADIRTRYSSPSAVDNLPWHGFGKICGDERDIDDGKYGMDAIDLILKQFGRKQ